MLTWGDLGDTVAVPNLTKLVRHAAQPTMAFDQVCNPPTGQALGRRAGDEVKYTFYPNVSTQGGALNENEEIPVTGLTPVTVSYTVTEYGNATKWTGNLQELAQLEIEDNFVQALVNDYCKCMNDAAYDAAVTTDWEFSQDATIADSTFVTDSNTVHTTDGQLTVDHLGLLVTYAKKNNIPYFDGESYVYITGVDAIEVLSSDSDAITPLAFTAGRALLNGEIGRIKQCRVVEDNHKIAKVATVYDEGFLIGADGLGSDVAQPVEIRREVSDFGRQIGVAWVSTEARYKIMDETSHDQEHIIHVTSA